MGDSKEKINNVLSSSKRQIATRVTMPQRPICTGMVCGHANEITFNIKQPLTEAMNNTKSAMSNKTSSQFTINASQNNTRSSGRMTYEPLLYNFKNESRNNFGRDFIPIDRHCDVILEEDRKNAEYYNRLDEIDDEVIVTGAVGVPKCYETWGDANFHPTLQNTITKSGYTKPRKIQAFAIPIIRDGFDIIGQSGSASGKTGAYLLPIIDVMLKSELKSGERAPFALIIAPTRELVLQIHEQARKFCDESQYECAKLYGQISNSYLQRELDSGCDILVSTPGRLNEFLFKEYLHLNKLRYVVLDEADRLMEYNFANDIPIFWNLHHVFH
uniref:RNA helicase n=1 Tax=Strongyloides venezuelensis TaxID=75913 RepID=A0A0K0EVQ9_STRVS